MSKGKKKTAKKQNDSSENNNNLGVQLTGIIISGIIFIIAIPSILHMGINSDDNSTDYIKCLSKFKMSDLGSCSKSGGIIICERVSGNTRYRNKFQTTVGNGIAYEKLEVYINDVLYKEYYYNEKVLCD